MQWDDIRMFLAVAREESLSGAGKRLKVDPATAGRRIARLEEDLGTTLFAKSPQGYAPTEAGMRMLRHVEMAEQAILAAEEEVRGRAGQLSGQIRLGAPDGVANFLLPQVCAEIVAQNPDLEVQIVALPRLFNLSRREADMAIAVSPPQTGRLTVEKLSDYRLHLVGAKPYLRASPEIASLADLKGHRMIGYIPDMIFDKELDYLEALGVDRVSLASNSVMVQYNWIRQNGGLGMMHDFAFASMRGLRKVLPDQIELTRSFWLVRHADDARLERMNRFAALLRDGIRREILRLEGEEELAA